MIHCGVSAVVIDLIFGVATSRLRFRDGDVFRLRESERVSDSFLMSILQANNSGDRVRSLLFEETSFV